MRFTDLHAIRQFREQLTRDLQRPEFANVVERLFGPGQYSVEIGTSSTATDGSNVTMKVTFAVTDAATGMAMTDAMRSWKVFAQSFGLDQEWLGKTFTFHGAEYKIEGLTPRRPKYPVNCKRADGKGFKFPAAEIIAAMNTAPKASKSATSRTDADILADLKAVALQLEPENLTWDGERPDAQVKQARALLDAQYARLVRELGRNPTDAEIWGDHRLD